MIYYNNKPLLSLRRKFAVHVVQEAENVLKYRLVQQLFFLLVFFHLEHLERYWLQQGIAVRLTLVKYRFKMK